MKGHPKPGYQPRFPARCSWIAAGRTTWLPTPLRITTRTTLDGGCVSGPCRARVPDHRATEDERVYFVCDGVDYHFVVRLKGEIIHEQEGMFTPFDLELTGRAEAGDVLEVRVFPAPKSRPVGENASEEELRSQADHSCKPAVSYEWDFHPRLMPLGIWQETFLEVRPSCIIAERVLDYRLSDDLQRAEISDVVCVDGLRGAWCAGNCSTRPDGASSSRCCRQWKRRRSTRCSKPRSSGGPTTRDSGALHQPDDIDGGGGNVVDRRSGGSVSARAPGDE